ncbi:MAG: hypothetical protein WD737_06110 [Gemmatimonadota bacterium]
MSLPDSEALLSALEDYPAVIARQGVSRLPELDRWYRDVLPASIRDRQPGRVTRDELVRITEWKMARGVWRGRNLALVRGNDPETVAETSERALSQIPHATKPISELAKLKGIGPATASAVAAAAAPDVYPFFDELVAAQLSDLGEVAWTMGYYARYSDLLRSAARDFGDPWTPARLERALWAHVGGKAGATD